MDNNIDNSFSAENGLKELKDEVLKARCESAYESLAISRNEFYKRAKISPQYWWRLSWGIDDFPLWFKKHLFREFGDAFAFLFSNELRKNKVEENENAGDNNAI